MKKVFATLRALVEVMEALSKDADPHGAGRHIMEEVPVSYLLFCMDH
jgi:callose synthase